MSKITSNFGTPVKVTVTERIEKEVDAIDIDWTKVPQGTIFTATADGKELVGRIFNDEGQIFLCQNEHSGSRSYTTLGYKESYTIESGSANRLNSHGITNFELYSEAPEGMEVLDMIEIPEAPIKAAGYNVVFHKDHISLGCQDVSHEIVNQINAKIASGFISPVDEEEGPEMEEAVTEDTAG